jgi:hypothetical protein
MEGSDQKAVAERDWMNWFVGFECRKIPVRASADEFLPDLLRRARALKAETLYLNSLIGA